MVVRSVATWLGLVGALHPPSPQPALRALVEVFARHPIVAIAEGHGLPAAGAFYIALVRDTAFQRTVNDIVVEFASRQSQGLLDRYVLTGDSLPRDSLESIWRNTTKTASWDFPIYARWLAAIRDVNRALPRGRRLRVLAGDTPVDWQRMHTPADWTALGGNDTSFAHVIATQVLAEGHKALVVLGSNHLMHGGSPRDGSPNTTSRLDAQFPGAVYVVLEFTGWPGGDSTDARIRAEAWPRPGLLTLPGSWLAPLPVGPAAHPLWRLADAVLYLGSAGTLKPEEPPSAYYDRAYLTELPRRAWLEWGDSSRLTRFLPPGHVTEHQVPSAELGGKRRVWVYTPLGYGAADSGDDNLLLAFDGGVYTGDIPLPHILDSLITAGAIPPTVAVLIDNASGRERLDDLANRARFASFVTGELMPWIRRRYRVSADPRHTVITGSSAGGLAAAYLAFKRPDLFGNVLSQSGAFWRGNEGSNGPPYEWLTGQYRDSSRRKIRFFLDVGSGERHGAIGGAAPSILDANRRLRDVLRARGYSVEYFEVPNGEHSPADWRTRLPIGLVALEGRPPLR